MYIIPKPYSMERNEGEFLLTYDSEIAIDNGCKEAYFYACLLKQEIKESAGFSPDIQAEETGRTAIAMKLEPEGSW